MTGLALRDTDQDAGEKGAKLKWAPKTWRPIYDQMIIMHIMGSKQTDIAEKLERTVVNVNNVLNCPQAQLIIKLLRDNVLKDAQATIGENIEASASKAAERMRAYIHDDGAYEKNPGAMVDRGLKILSAMGHTKTGEGSGHGINVGGNAFFVDGDGMDKLVKALEDSKRAALMHGEVGSGDILGTYTDMK